MLLSIIIPVYHTELKLLNRCLSSLTSQKGIDWKNVEILLIDDGEKKSKFDFHISGDSIKIKVLRTPGHLGAGLARQYGIDKSKGKWIYFVDSDDEMMSEFSLCYIIESIKSNAQKLMYTFYHMNESRGNAIMGYCMASLYCVCVRKDILTKYDIRFLPTTLYEDIAFIGAYVYLIGFDAIQDCNALPVYWYRVNKQSVTQGVTAIEHAKLAFENDLQCILYIDYKMTQFCRVDNSFYIYSMFRLMNEVSRLQQLNITEDDSVLQLFVDILDKLQHKYMSWDQNQINSVAKAFGSNADWLVANVNKFLYNNPLLESK